MVDEHIKASQEYKDFDTARKEYYNFLSSRGSVISDTLYNSFPAIIISRSDKYSYKTTKDAIGDSNEYSKLYTRLNSTQSKLLLKINQSKENNMTRIILVGKGGSGKDFLKKKMIERGFVREVSYTTRPMRTGEAEGKDYFYVEESDFKRMITAGEFYQHDNFNGWYYGTSKAQWEKKSLFIMTPGGIAKIKPEDRKECFIIYIDINEEIRKERLSQRSDADSVDRRLAADENDFKDFTDFDMRVTNPDF